MTICLNKITTLVLRIGRVSENGLATCAAIIVTRSKIVWAIFGITSIALVSIIVIAHQSIDLHSMTERVL
jgi:hypothetical protein